MESAFGGFGVSVFGFGLIDDAGAFFGVGTSFASSLGFAGAWRLS